MLMGKFEMCCFFAVTVLAPSILECVKHESGVSLSVCHLRHIPKVTHQWAAVTQPAYVLAVLFEG